MKTKEIVLKNKTKQFIFKTNYNGIKLDSDYEKVDPVSMTVPNETYSLREIVEKFSREYPKSLLRTGYYDQINEEDPDFDDIDLTRSVDFDLTDAIELKQKIQSKAKTRSQVIKETLDVKKDSPQPSEV